ncbi:phage protein [Acetobacterium wieringae]|uniref:phage protein n=1 Tax=Acetobacterium wieringae TaxID=52694 RepID=UPI002B1F7B95|nr:phage tail tip lysozyme [Acetobacterium wieringae]MEA4805079.1 phage tail tip lysozyme [Acetobacterium wieringae]
MSNLFRRKKQLIINNVLMPDLEIDFNITFNADDEQPVNDVSIVNLTPETIRGIGNGQVVILNAGYGDNMGNLLVGKISDVATTSDAVDRSLKLMVAPDVNVTLSTTVSKSYAPGTMASFVVKDLLNGIGLEVGTIKLNADICYTDGKIFSGTVDAALKEIVKATGSFMFVRCNIIYIVDSVYEIDTGILLNKSTGLIGSPEVVDINGAKGYKIKSLLNPMLTLGSVFRLESKYLSGLFRVQDGTHTGDFITTVNCLPTDEVSRYVPPVKNSGGSGENTPKGKIWTFLINKGFSKAATAGVMGNIELESGYDTNAENASGAYGLFQWLGGRREGLEAYATAKSCPVDDLQLQMEYFYEEITTGAESACFPTYTDLPSLDAFKALTDPEAAAILFENAFERSGGAGMSQRIEYALAVYAWDGGKAAGSGGGSGGDGNFPAGAFQCECGCGLDCVPELKNKMNQIWDNVGGNIQITGPARCEYQNSITPGSSPNSLHMTGEACDCYIPGAGVDYLANAAQAVGLGTLRYYSSGFVHCQTYPADQVMD